jgi:hypothetical protein
MTDVLECHDPGGSTELDSVATLSRRARNDQNWDSLKDKIYSTYMTEILAFKHNESYSRSPRIQSCFNIALQAVFIPFISIPPTQLVVLSCFQA